MEKAPLIIDDAVNTLRIILRKLVMLKAMVNHDLTSTDDGIYAWRDIAEMTLADSTKEMNEILSRISEKYKDIEFEPIESI